jgi:hypothetical protein
MLKKKLNSKAVIAMNAGDIVSISSPTPSLPPIAAWHEHTLDRWFQIGLPRCPVATRDLIVISRGQESTS